MAFQGISFSNPGYLCYCSATVNGLLASDVITSNLVQGHCFTCKFLLSKRTDASTEQSSLPLKKYIAASHEQFNSTRQQDPSEFLDCLLKKCDVLSELTRS